MEKKTKQKTNNQTGSKRTKKKNQKTKAYKIKLNNRNRSYHKLN